MGQGICASGLDSQTTRGKEGVNPGTHREKTERRRRSHYREREDSHAEEVWVLADPPGDSDCCSRIRNSKCKVSSVTCLYLNARSLIQKMDYFRATVQALSPDIIGITELGKQ